MVQKQAVCSQFEAKLSGWGQHPTADRRGPGPHPRPPCWALSPSPSRPIWFGSSHSSTTPFGLSPSPAHAQREAPSHAPHCTGFPSVTRPGEECGDSQARSQHMLITRGTEHQVAELLSPPHLCFLAKVPGRCTWPRVGVRVCADGHSAGCSVSLSGVGDSIFPINSVSGPLKRPENTGLLFLLGV